MSRIDRSDFLSPIPVSALNSKADALSTLECRDDTWGTKPEHYRFINLRDANNNLIPRKDDPKKYEKSLRLIGQPHLEWQDYYIKIRVDKDHFKWYKHWPMAVNLYHFGKLDEKAIAWVKEEGALRFQKGQIPTLGVNGKLTLAVQVLVKLGILTAKGTSVSLTSEGDINIAKKIAETPAITPVVLEKV